MESAVGYENELNAHVKRERAAVVLASKTGELLYDKGIELVLFRNHLLDISISEILNLHEYAKKVVNKSYLWMLDRIAAPIALAAGFIRLGNLVNHEMVGEPTTLPWGFRFLHHDCPFPYDCPWEMIPVRHPAQLYESICYFITFGVLMWLFWKKEAWKNQGSIIGTFLIMVFGARFFVEFVKLGQTARDEYLALNTGQLLSIPLVLVGVYLLYSSWKKKQIAPKA
jgi:prolipoprotein diacylglyceryl transferase